jgi:hypothetical protein
MRRPPPLSRFPRARLVRQARIGSFIMAAALIRAGGVRGNGGGAPVSVHGWTCQGYTSAEIARTSRVSFCVKGSAEIFAVLPPPTAANAPPVPS